MKTLIKNVRFFDGTKNQSTIRLINDTNANFDEVIDGSVHKVTGEPGPWFNLDAGYLTDGGRADFVLVNPEGLNEDVLNITEAHFPEMNNMKRLVNRNDKAVTHVYINGRLAFKNAEFQSSFGQEKGFGRFLEAKV